MDPQRPNNGQSKPVPTEPDQSAPVHPLRQPVDHINVPERNPTIPSFTPPPEAPIAPEPQNTPPAVSPPPPVSPPAPSTPPVPQQPVQPTIPPVPANILPPSSPPTVPTLQPPAPQQPPEPIVEPTPAPPPPVRVIPSTPTQEPPVAIATNNPPSAEPTPPPVPKSPSKELIDRIGEVPVQNSSDVAKQAGQKKRLHRLRGFISFIIFIAGIFIAAFLINQFIFQSYYVEGSSMVPTLQNDDRLIIDKTGRTAAMVQGKPYIPTRGDIIVLDSSIISQRGRQEQLIKRVIGLPGETVIIERGEVTIKNQQSPNGFNVDKELGLNLEPTYIGSRTEVKVPDGQLYVMGDNRVENGSYDSRSFGPIESKDIAGRLWARILPLNTAKVF